MDKLQKLVFGPNIIGRLQELGVIQTLRKEILEGFKLPEEFVRPKEPTMAKQIMQEMNAPIIWDNAPTIWDK
jgi:hypothetical protein